MNEPTAQKARRWRFQFSLRTLLIAVLVYGLLWLLTYKIGGTAFAEKYAQRYRKRVTDDNLNGYFRIEQKSTALRVEITNGSHPSVVIKGEAFAPAPFIVLWKWEVQGTQGEMLQLPSGPQPEFGIRTDYRFFPDTEKRTEVFGWFFGIRNSSGIEKLPYLGYQSTFID